MPSAYLKWILRLEISVIRTLLVISCQNYLSSGLIFSAVKRINVFPLRKPLLTSFTGFNSNMFLKWLLVGVSVKSIYEINWKYNTVRHEFAEISVCVLDPKWSKLENDKWGDLQGPAELGALDCLFPILLSLPWWTFLFYPPANLSSIWSLSSVIFIILVA